MKSSSTGQYKFPAKQLSVHGAETLTVSYVCIEWVSPWDDICFYLQVGLNDRCFHYLCEGSMNISVSEYQT